MNPAVAKLTPWLLEIFADSLSDTGIVITEVTVSAMDSWVQFFKNMPIGLIAFVIIQSSIFTKEYQSGTLILSLTKGLERYKVVLSKVVVLSLLWSMLYWMSFFITYGYNSYFWDNSIAQNLTFSVVCWWLFGGWLVSLIALFSVLATTNISVIAMSGCVVLISYVVGFIPKINKYLPTQLTDGTSLIFGYSDTDGYITALLITLMMIIISFAASILLFNKKQLW